MNEYHKHLNRRTKQIIETTIDDLQREIGLSHDDALALLVVQSAVRMNAAAIRRAIGGMLNENNAGGD
jgi:hypothetical protein